MCALSSSSFDLSLNYPARVLCVLSIMAKTLPSDIILNILSRLPTESLSECSLVCKPWQNLIYYDRSLARMLSRRVYDQDSVDAVTSGKASFLYLFNSVKGHTLFKHLEYDDEKREKPLKFEIAKFIPVPDHAPVEIIGSCNGLVCISVFSKKNDTIQDPIYICNPMTREFVYLPKLTNKFSRGDYVVSGFGYHPSTNQYKVVRIYCHAASKKKPFVGCVQVYTLGSGEGWRNLEDITYELHPSVSNEILVNGALHWLDEDGQIVKFDLFDETFSVLPKQEDIDYNWDCHRRIIKGQSDIFWDFELRVLGGCLRVIKHGKRADTIWSFKKRDGQLSKDENIGKQDIKEEHCNSSWGWVEEYFDWNAVDYDTWTKTVFPLAILKDSTKIVFHDNIRYYYRQDLAGYRYELIADDHLPHHAVRFVKSFVSLKALGEEEAKIMEYSEGAQELPRADLDTDNEWKDQKPRTDIDPKYRFIL